MTGKVVFSMAVGFLPLFCWAGAEAATIWTGPRRTFSKANLADYNQATNQDRITQGVWLTRADSAGMFNIAAETSYFDTSPANTRWAYGSTTNLPAVFTNWVTWSQHNPTNTIGRDAVVYLVSEDIYFDIRFTAFTSGGGGGFAYERTGYVPLTMKGPALTAVSRHGIFTDPGATASNSAGVPLVVTVSGSVDAATPGDYFLTYSATDSLGFVASTNRLVSVLETNSAPSWWLASYNLGTNVTASQLDSDEDGLANWAEYLAGTVPTNKDSVFRISAILSGTGLSWPSASGRVYSVCQTTNLAEPFSVLPGGSNVVAHPPENIFTNIYGLPSPVRYFKVEVGYPDP